ncbi:unnamed protein product [Caenorhabditis sp. 36 PRJEB53466]|nr:unnamed protein product [Caenorhabditis sp. 36 PRJEB53466]
MKRPFRCPYLVTAAIVGASAVAVAFYFYWSNRNNEKKKAVEATPPSTATATASSSGSITSETPSDPTARADGGKELDGKSDIFKFSDENVRVVCERLFLEQMDLGEEYMSDAETVERGAMHLANAIALTGETEPLLKVLRKAVSPTNFTLIQKYIPTAEIRVHQLLQDELTVESIAENFI